MEKKEKDSKNPNIQLRKREILGLTFLKGFKFDDDNWDDGKIYNARDGKLTMLTLR